jgi:sugar phosphate permease
MVSSATGFLDFLSYMAAAIATAVFGNIVTFVGWGNLILIWTALSVLGVFVSVTYGKRAFMKSDKPKI